jgi:hypothetical protein
MVHGHREKTFKITGGRWVCVYDVHMCIYVRIYTLHIHLYICHIYRYIYIYIYIYTYTYIHIYAYVIYAGIFVCACVYTCL